MENKRTVLVVDDDRSVHAIVGRILEKMDATVIHAFDGAEALKIARTTPVDLIITDALIPRLDGRELAKIIKSDPELSSTRVVVMTALYKGARYRMEALHTFLADDYIEKPVSVPKLQSIFEAAFASKEGELRAAV